MSLWLLAVLALPPASLCDALTTEGVVEGKFIVSVARDFSDPAYCVIDRRGVRRLPLVPESWGSGASWSPDGASVFLVSCAGMNRSADCPVVQTDLEGNILRTIPPLPASGFVESDGRVSRLQVRNPRPAPRGDRLAVISGDGLRVLSLTGLGEVSLLAPGVQDAAWSPDGRQLIVLKNRFANAPAPSEANAYVLDADTGRETPLSVLDDARTAEWRNTRGVPTFDGLTVAGAGSVIAVIENREGGALVADLRTDTVRHVELTGRCSRDPSLSANGEALSYLSCESGRRWVGSMPDELRVLDLRTERDTVVARVSAEDVSIASASWWTEGSQGAVSDARRPVAAGDAVPSP